MNSYKQILVFLKEQKIKFTSYTDKNISPYAFIKLDTLNVMLHFISPNEESLHWHNEDALLNVAEKYSNNKVIHLWSDAWVNYQEGVKSRLISLTNETVRIFARKLTIKKIDINTLHQFIEINHINGSPKAKVKYGLFLKEQLVAVASFSGRRTINDREGLKHISYELIRYCTLNNHTIVGGLSKILKQFILEYSPDDIMTYTDSDWSQGESFKKLGFDLIEVAKPFVFEWDTHLEKRVKRYGEEQYCNKIYNSGSNKYVLNLNRINN